jgi:hypothetical protein
VLKHIDDLRKSGRELAKRRWHNHAVEKSFKAAQKEATEGAAKEPKVIEPSDTQKWGASKRANKVCQRY